MNIPHNSLMEKIKELVRLCKQIASDYGDDASWFKQPASACRLDQSVQVLDQCRFTGAGVTNDPDKFTVRDFQRHILQRMLFICSSFTVYIIDMF